MALLSDDDMGIGGNTPPPDTGAATPPPQQAQQDQSTLMSDEDMGIANLNQTNINNPNFYNSQAEPSEKPAMRAGLPPNQSQPLMSDDDMGIKESSAGGAFGRTVEEGAFPASAAIAGGELGSEIGTAMFPGVGTVAGLGVGAAAGLAYGYLASKGQDWVLDKFGLREHLGLDPAQRQADTEQHPGAVFAGEGLNALIGGARPTTALALKARALGVGVMGGMSVGQQYAETGEVDPMEAAKQAAIGAALPVGAPSTGLAKKIGNLITGGTEGRTVLPTIPQRTPSSPPKANVGGAAPEIKGVSEQDILNTKPNTNPALGTAFEEPAAKGETEAEDLEYYDPGNPPDAAGTQTAPMKERVAATANDPVRRNLLKTNTGVNAAARIDTVSSTTGAPPVDNGVDETFAAALNKKPSQPGGALRPQGIPEVQRMPPAAQQAIQAGRPQEQAPAPQPAATAPAPQPPVETGLVQAHAAQQPQVPFPQAKNTNDIVRLASQAAVRRPLVETPMPSIANSSRDLNGPVVVNPGIPPEYHRPLAIHETVEQSLMAHGYDYDTAHDIATRAEMKAVRGAGIDAQKYSDFFTDHAKQIEGIPVDPATYQKYNLHVDPMEAIGHHANKIGPSGEISPKEGVSASAEKPVTAAVKEPELTDAQKRTIEATRAFIAKENPDLLATFDAKSQAEKAASAQSAIDEAVEQEKVAARTKRTGVRPTRGEGEEAVQINASRKERIDRSAAAIKGAVDEFAPDDDKLGVIPETDDDKEELIGRLTGMVKSAADRNNGGSPLRAKTGGYKPNKVPAEWSLLDQAEKLVAAKNPSDAKIAKFIADEKLLRTGGKEAAQEFQAGRREEADQDLRQFPENETAQENMIAQDRALDTQAPTFPKFDNSNGDESKVYEDQQNGLRNWWNNLDPDDQNLLFERHPDIENNVNTVQDPARLHEILEGDLEGLQKYRPAGKTIPVVKAEDIKRLAPTEPGAAASEGKSRADLLAEYNARLAAGDFNVHGNTADRLAIAKKAANETTDERTRDKQALWGDWGAAKKNVENFVKDEQGGAPIPKWLTKTGDTIKDVFSPDVDRGLEAANEEYGKSFEDVGKELHTKIPGMYKQMTERIKQDTAELRGMVQKAAGFNMKPTEKRDLHRAEEVRDTSKLPSELQGYYATIDKPLKEELDRRVNAIKNLHAATGIGRDVELIGDGITDYLPHMRADKQLFNEAENRQVMPTPENTLSHQASNLQPRKYFALRPVDAAGNEDPSVKPQLLARTFDAYNKPTGWTTATNKQIKGLPPGWGTKLNEPFIGKGGQKYLLDNARVKELNAAGLKDEDGNPITFHENSTLALIQANHEAQVVLEKNRLAAEMQRLFDDHELSTTSANEAVAKGWAASASRADLQKAMTSLPELEQKGQRDQYFPPNIRWELDHIHQQGYNDLPGITRASQAMLKTMFFTQPFIHAGNVLDNFITARGFDNFRPSGYNWKTMVDANKMIREGADNADYRRWVMAGGNPMLRNVQYRDFAIKNARDLGEHIAMNPATWDPIARKFGMTSKELRRTIYDATQRPMWYMADTMSAHRFLENERLYGMAPEKAAQQANEWLPTYHTPATVGMQNEAGRKIAKIINSPAFLAFGPYTYEKLATFGRMNLKLAQMPVAVYKQGRLTRENTRPLGQAIMMYGVMPWIVYNAADKALQYATGDKNATMTRRGVAQIPSMLADVATHNKGILAPAKEFSPSIPANLLKGVAGGYDWAGHPITQEGSSIPEQVKQAGVWAGSQAVPPISDLLQGIKTGHPLQHFLAGQVGAHIPSPAEDKYLNQKTKIDQRAVKRYEKTKPF